MKSFFQFIIYEAAQSPDDKYHYKKPSGGGREHQLKGVTGRMDGKQKALSLTNKLKMDSNK